MRRFLKRGQRRQHDDETALHIGHPGAIEARRVFQNPWGLKGVVGLEDGIIVPAAEHFHGSVRSEFGPDSGASFREGNAIDVRGELTDGIHQCVGHARQACGVMRAGVDVTPGD